MAAKEVEGPVVVQMEGEEIVLSDCERELLTRGPKYCVLRSCNEEEMVGNIECSTVKYKWDEMAQGEEEKGELSNMSEEERVEQERLDAVADEMAAETRCIFSEEDKTWNLNKKRVTDYKANSRVILPRALPAEGESKLEVMRIELLTEYRQWVKENCDCKGRQKANLSKRESDGLKSLQKRIKDGDLVVLPTRGERSRS